MIHLHLILSWGRRHVIAAYFDHRCAVERLREMERIAAYYSSLRLGAFGPVRRSGGTEVPSDKWRGIEPEARDELGDPSWSLYAEGWSIVSCPLATPADAEKIMLALGAAAGA